MNKPLVNAILFHIVWVVCIQGSNELAALATLLFLVVHGVFFIKNPTEWVLIIGVASVGTALDSVILNLGFFEFFGKSEFVFDKTAVSLAPVWLACLWLSFATTINHSFYWLHNRLPILFVICLCIIPFSYFVGARVSGSTIQSPLFTALFAEALQWVFVFPTALMAAKKMRLMEAAPSHE